MSVLGNQRSNEATTNNKPCLAAKSKRLDIPMYGAFDCIEIHYSSSKGFVWCRTAESGYNSTLGTKRMFNQYHGELYTAVELFCSGAELDSKRKDLFFNAFGVTIQSLTDKFRSKNATVELEKIY